LDVIGKKKPEYEHDYFGKRPTSQPLERSEKRPDTFTEEREPVAKGNKPFNLVEKKI